MIEHTNTDRNDSFLDLVFMQAQRNDWSMDELFEVHQKLLWLANGLCSAAQVETYDTAGLNRVLEQCKALVGLGLEYVSDGDISYAVEILKEEYPQTLFKAALGLIDDLREEFIKSAKQLSWAGIAELDRAFLGRRWGEIQMLLSRKSDWLGVDQLETLKGLFNRFPMVSFLNEEKQCIEFDTLKNMTVLNELKENTQAVCGAIYLAELSGVDQDSSMEKGLSDALTQVLLDKSFEAVEPTELEKDSLLKSDFMSLKSRYVAFSNALIEQLKASSDKWWKGMI